MNAHILTASDITLHAPLDITELIFKKYFEHHIQPFIHKTDTSKWMNKCSLSRKRMVMEVGAIQLGHTDYDGWVSVYTPTMRGCHHCENNKHFCNECVTKRMNTQ